MTDQAAARPDPFKRSPGDKRTEVAKSWRPAGYDVMRVLLAGIGSHLTHPHDGEPFTLVQILAGADGVTLVLKRDSQVRQDRIVYVPMNLR